MPWSVDNFPGRSPKSWDFQASNDGINWIVLDSRSNYTTYTAWTYTDEFTFSNNTTYTYYRFLFHTNVGGISYLGLSGIKLNVDNANFWITSNNILPIRISPTTTEISVYSQNSSDDSPAVTQSYTYSGNIETPYPPANVKVIPKGSYASISWSPCVRQCGANYRSCDTILSGQDEGTVEGTFNIYKNSVFYTSGITNTLETFLTYDIIEAGIWGVSTQLGAYESEIIQVVVTATDLL
jgi:hypothetical protein